MEVNSGRWLVSMLVQNYVERGFIGIWWGLLVTTRGSTIVIELTCVLEWLLFIVCWWGLLIVTKRSTITIVLGCIVEWLLLMAHWRRLLLKGLIKSLWLLPSLIVPSLIQAFIVISISYNIIVTKLIAKGVRIHGKRRK